VPTGSEPVKLADAPRFMSHLELAAELAHYEYLQPGYKMSLYLDPFEGSCLYVVAMVPNGYKPTEQTQLRIRSLVPPCTSPTTFGHWLLWRLCQIATHEVRELLHYKGKPLVDPHDTVEP
jgi:hypothetical protein